LSYAKEIVLIDIFCRLGTMHERDRRTQTDTQITSITIGEMPPKNIKRLHLYDAREK